jgi:DNA-binding NarL/FixJ family response regulator
MAHDPSLPPEATLARNGPFVKSLTCRESDVWLLIAQGESNAQIAKELSLSVHTIKRHVVRVLRKLDVRSRSEAASVYRRFMAGFSTIRDELGPERQRVAFEVFTSNERIVLERIANGHSNLRIAEDLSMSVSTVKRIASIVFTKLGARSRVQAAGLFALLPASSSRAVTIR